MRIAFLLPLVLVLLVRPAAAEQPVPIAAFFDYPSVSAAKLAPDGKRLAVRVNSKDGHDRLAVLTLPDLTVHVVGGFKDSDVGHFEWVNNGRLIYDTRDKNTPPGQARYWSGVFAVNADGSVHKELASPIVPVQRRVYSEAVFHTFMLDQPGAQDSNKVYLAQTEYEDDGNVNRVHLLQVDTVRGTREDVARPGRTREWWLDAHGRPALAVTVEAGVETLHWLDPKDGKWHPVPGADGFTPLGFAPDGILYVTSRGRRDKRAPFAYDLVTGKMAERPLLDLDAYDFDGSLVNSASRLLGIR
jgi:hypothetical protein